MTLLIFHYATIIRYKNKENSYSSKVNLKKKSQKATSKWCVAILIMPRRWQQVIGCVYPEMIGK